MPFASVQPGLQIYQVGQGEIKSDGSAFIAFTPAIITSARVEGTASRAIMINPTVLRSGVNTITVKFDNISQLILGSYYVITIGLKVGGLDGGKSFS